jgi:DnaJ-class molecular chaperone
MRKSSPPAERKCDACNGTGFLEAKQPAKPGRKIYPPRCPKCAGKGRLAEPNPK